MTIKCSADQHVEEAKHEHKAKRLLVEPCIKSASHKTPTAAAREDPIPRGISPEQQHAPDIPPPPSTNAKTHPSPQETAAEARPKGTSMDKNRCVNQEKPTSKPPENQECKTSGPNPSGKTTSSEGHAGTM